jgi:hypothetical protein
MQNARLSSISVVATITAALALTGALEVTALQAKDRHDLKPHYYTRAYCMQCHSDERSVDMMKLKEGSCPFLFTKGEKGDVAKRLDAYVRAHPNSVHPAYAGYGRPGSQAPSDRWSKN